MRRLFTLGKLANVAFQMERLKSDVLGITDVQLPGSRKYTADSGIPYFLGTNVTTYRYGVATLMVRKINNCVVNFIPYSDRIMTKTAVK